MEEARRLGKAVHIYNQGRTRYSFGMYQWSEYRKGVQARTEWHLNILHGYQFFDERAQPVWFDPVAFNLQVIAAIESLRE
jgi:hypothetical protein